LETTWRSRDAASCRASSLMPPRRPQVVSSLRPSAAAAYGIAASHEPASNAWESGRVRSIYRVARVISAASSRARATGPTGRMSCSYLRLVGTLRRTPGAVNCFGGDSSVMDRGEVEAFCETPSPRRKRWGVVPFFKEKVGTGGNSRVLTQRESIGTNDRWIALPCSSRAICGLMRGCAFADLVPAWQPSLQAAEITFALPTLDEKMGSATSDQCCWAFADASDEPRIFG